MISLLPPYPQGSPLPMLHAPSSPPIPPLVLGIVGGVGSGKSTVSRILEGLGAEVLEADAFVREAHGDPKVLQALAARFGDDVLESPEGPIHRAKLATAAFGQTGDRQREARAYLEALLHPRVRYRMGAALAEIRGQQTPPPLVILDVPLLLEGPLSTWCHEVLFVEAPAKERTRRTVRDRNWGDAERSSRERAQMPLLEKRRRAHRIIRNDASLDLLKERVIALLEELKTHYPAISQNSSAAEAADEPADTSDRN